MYVLETEEKLGFFGSGDQYVHLEQNLTVVEKRTLPNDDLARSILPKS